MINAYSARNMGDAAINLATVALLRRGGAESVEIAGRDYRHDRAFYSGFNITTVPPAIPFAPPGEGSFLIRGVQLILGTLRAVLLLIPISLGFPDATEALARWSGSDGLLEILAADVVILAGGGYLFSATRRINASLLHSLAIIWVAVVTHKRIVMMPQSIGPLRGWFDRWAVTKTLEHVSPIVVREESAFDEVTKLIQPTGMQLVPDVSLYGWVSSQDPTQVSSSQSNGKRVGIVVMDWTWARNAGAAELERYMRELAGLIAGLTSAGTKVVVLGGSNLPEVGQDDMVVARRIAALASEMGTNAELVEVVDPEGFKFLLSTLDAIVGTRLHSCLLALSCGVPAIALGYQPKTQGTYELLGIDELCHDVQTFTAASLLGQVFAMISPESRWRERVMTAAANARTQIEEFYGALI